MKFDSIAKKIVLAVLALVICVAVTVWYFLTRNEVFDNSGVQTAYITQTEIATEYQKPRVLNVWFNQAAARIDLLQKVLTERVQIQPEVRGEWMWMSDTALRFIPETDFLPDTKYVVVLPKEIFNQKVKVKDKYFKFTSPAFLGNIASSEFYEDPRNVHNKAAVATFEFNYPLNESSIWNGVAVETISGKKYDFTYKIDETGTKLHIVSAPIEIAQAVDFAKINVFGIESAYNPKKISAPVMAKVEIPSAATYFKLESMYATITHNEMQNNQPEQVLFVNFSTAVATDELAKYFELYYTPSSCEETRTQLVQKQYEVTALSGARKVAVDEVSKAHENAKTHIFKYDINASNGCLIPVIRQGLPSVEGYRLAQNIVQPVYFAEYPREVGIVAEGAILPLKGSKEVGFISRGVNELKITVAQIAENNLNHLVTQTDGDFAHPFFQNYYFDENNIAEVFEKTLKINQKHPAEASYSSIDLGKYFKDKKGIFLLRLVGFAGEYYSSNIEKRLVVVTDLGIVVKDNTDGSHELFVSDITSQMPVAAAKVEVLGKNGLPILTAVTNADGMAEIPDFSSFKNDKEAVVYKVSNNNDISFLPINRYDRRLNMSRFDVGGEYDYKQGEYSLKSYIFSDRGIYRPGETAYFGILVRQTDLQVPQKLPYLLEVRNPNGDITATAALQADAVGLAEYKLDLAPNAVTGLYNLSLYVRGANNQRNYVTETTFKVEEFLPDTLKIKAEWQDVPVKGWTTQKEVQAVVELANLYGTAAANHQLKAYYELVPAVFKFEEYKGYAFLTPNAAQKRKSYTQELAPVMTNEAGKGMFTVDVANFADGPYALRMYIEGFELGGGRGVKTVLGTLLAENDYLIGWKADGDLNYLHKESEHNVAFIAINNSLEKISKDNLTLKLVRKDYISSLTEQPNGTYRYQMVPKEVMVSQQPWQIAKDGTEVKLQTQSAGEYILRVEDAAETVLAQVEFTVAGDLNMQYAIDKDAGLGLKLNKTEYMAGEEIEMQITAPYSGYGLITIERDKVYAYKWFRADKSSVVANIILPNTVEGNAYVNVAFFRDVKSPEIYMPSLSYAAVPFNINRSQRELKINLQVPQTVKSGSDLIIKYNTSEKAKIIIYGVNQGILQVARYKMPDPLGYLLQKRALRVVTVQIMDLILPDMRILRNLAASGGDDSYEAALNANLNPFARKNAKPVAFWSGIIDSDGKDGVYRYSVPESFNGEIKVMAVAVADTRFGSADKTVVAHSDFALIVSGPLNVAPGDEFVLGLSVADLTEDNDNGGTIKISVNPDTGFEVIGEQTQTVNLNKKEEKLLKFRLKALSELGGHEIMFTAQSADNADKKAKMPYTMSIRPATPYNSSFQMGKAHSEYTLSGIENLYPQYRVQQVAASSSPLVLAAGLLKYLDDFPHACTEQTISKVFPAIEVFFKEPELVKNIDVYALYDDAIGKLYERQTMSGGFSAWSIAGALPDDYASVYATHFLVSAHEHNFNVSQGMLSQALNYCQTQAGKYPENVDDFLPAYAAYVLTRSGMVTSNYLLNLEEFYKEKYPKQWQKSLGASFLAASYRLLQNEAKAYQLAGNYEYLDDTAQNAMNDYLLAVHFPDLFQQTKADKVKQLLDALKNGNFTTKSASWATLALNAFSRVEKDTDIHFNQGKTHYTPFPTVDFTPETKGLKVSASEPFYYNVSQSGFWANNQVASKANGLEISKELVDKNGVPVQKAALGDELTVKIYYRSLSNVYVPNVAIVDLLAGCFEPVAGSLQFEYGAETSEIREDRVVAYVSALPQRLTLSYKVKVIAEGEFVVPAVFASGLYQPLARANSASAVISIGND